MNRLVVILSPLVLVAYLLSAKSPDFRKDVAPILRQYCAGCHNDADREAELSLETHASLMRGGETGPAILTGDKENSFLFRTISHQKKPFMPPRKEPQLTAPQREIIGAWIQAGAKGPDRDVSILANLITPAVPPLGLPEIVSATAVSLDEKLRAKASYGKLTFGKHVRTKLPGKINALDFSPDGRTLGAATGVTGLHGVALLFDVKSGKARSNLSGHRDILTDLAFSPNGKRLATSSYDKSIRIWNPENGNLLHELHGHNGAVHGIAFSPDSSLLASAGADNSVRIWKVESGKRLDTRAQPTGEQYDVSFSPDGKYFLSTGADRQIRLWRLKSLHKPDINPLAVVRFAHESEIVNHKISLKNRTLTTTDANGISKMWTLPTLVEKTKSQAAHDGNISGGKAISEKNTKIFKLSLPGKVNSVLESGEHLYSFEAGSGEEWIFETEAARMNSPLDSKIEILHPDGSPVERVRLQAMRESWLTFRGKDSKTSNDFRLFKWDEMSLNQLLYVNGEVVKLWHYPRGPDSGYIVYPGTGNRRTYFDTTPLAHPLGQPAYVVEPLPKESRPQPNGLPTFTLNYSNDDDSSRKLGKDSSLTFCAPTKGMYLARVTDVRGKRGKEFKYSLTVRPRKPDFNVSLTGPTDGIPEGGAREFTLQAERIDGFEGPIQVNFNDLPKGIHLTTPVTIQAGQTRAYGVVSGKATGSTSKKLEKPKVPANPHLSAIDWSLYHGMWENIPEWDKLDPVKTGKTQHGYLDLSVADREDHFGIRFSAQIKVPRDGRYEFFLESDDGSILKIDGREVVNNDGLHGKLRKSGTQELKAGTRKLELSYIQATGLSELYVSWKGPGMKETPLSHPDSLQIDLPKILAKASAQAKIGGKKRIKKLNDLAMQKPLPKPKILVEVLPGEGNLPEDLSFEKPLELTISPGETISARVRIVRNGFNGQVSLGNHDAGRNLPHGVYVDNIGLNGLLIVQGQDEREFFITCDDWVKDTSRLFHLKTKEEKGIASRPVLLHVRKKLAAQ